MERREDAGNNTDDWEDPLAVEVGLGVGADDLPADVTQQDSVARISTELKTVKLGGIVNSAGIFLDTDFANFNQ